MSKKDSGIARLTNGVLIPEELRDDLIRRYKEPPEPKPAAWNPDRATTKELEEHRYSGIRVNVMTADVEMWAVGKMLAREKLERIQKNPKKLADLHEKAFQTGGSLIAIPVEVRQVRPPHKRKKGR